MMCTYSFRTRTTEQQNKEQTEEGIVHRICVLRYVGIYPRGMEGCGGVYTQYVLVYLVGMDI